MEQFIHSSRDLAERFGKKHYDIMAIIRNMECSQEEKNERFLPTTYIDRKGQSRPEFLLTQPGYDLMCARFTGLGRLQISGKENAALDAIEQILDIKLIRQFGVFNYRVDGYHPETNTAYEIDEVEHKQRLEQDEKRQKEIEQYLGCKFVRIKLTK